jgi:hypothetical protein
MRALSRLLSSFSTIISTSNTAKLMKKDVAIKRSMGHKTTSLAIYLSQSKKYSFSYFRPLGINYILMRTYIYE